jgi:F-type H+-transporting ATPase subunit a
MAADNPIDPIHQFEISKIADIQLGGIDISFTNSSLFMVFALAATMAICYWSF